MTPGWITVLKLTAPMGLPRRTIVPFEEDGLPVFEKRWRTEWNASTGTHSGPTPGDWW